MRNLAFVLLCLACGPRARPVTPGLAPGGAIELGIAVPFTGEPGVARVLTLDVVAAAEEGQDVGWGAALLAEEGAQVATWAGTAHLTGGHFRGEIPLVAAASAAFPEGLYRLVVTVRGLTTEAEAEAPVRFGAPPPPPAARTLAALVTTTSLTTAATGSLPYTVVYGNFHAQTNHSDGGVVPSQCTHAETPQAGAKGPADAYKMMDADAGGDFLLTSEHNHMYDGSASGTSVGPRSVTDAKALFTSGRNAASAYRSAHAGFVAIYGTEWGLASAGHVNILNPTGLINWEKKSGVLVGTYEVAKSDYAALYALLKSKSWVGQFNHPGGTQFAIGGTALAYDANGDAAMALCEVWNTSAFASGTTETDNSGSSFESTCKKLLLAGYHVAFSSNQDNHCANWGLSYTNRTGVLIPQGTTFTLTSLLAAVRARRVFATMDKHSQIIFTAGGHVMGERFDNSGGLALKILFSNTAGRTVTRYEVWHGQPGGTSVTRISTSDEVTITPAAGDHFYYARIVQDDGDVLWSAPVWVHQE